MAEQPVCPLVMDNKPLSANQPGPAPLILEIREENQGGRKLRCCETAEREGDLLNPMGDKKRIGCGFPVFVCIFSPTAVKYRAVLGFLSLFEFPTTDQHNFPAQLPFQPLV